MTVFEIVVHRNVDVSSRSEKTVLTNIFTNNLHVA